MHNSRMSAFSSGRNRGSLASRREGGGFWSGCSSDRSSLMQNSWGNEEGNMDSAAGIFALLVR